MKFPRIPSPGCTIDGRYQIGRLVSRGAMGFVYDAIDLETGNETALKILPPDSLQTTALKRFVREARVTASIDHPHVVKVFGAGLIDGVLPYIAMEMLEGETLEKRLRAVDLLPVHVALSVLSDLLSALEASHSVGVLHRDIKPGNVFLCLRGAVLFDFGLCLGADRSTRLTGQGITVGTPGYMAPEQVKGDEVDVRTDIYNAAATTYEALTSFRPIAPRETSVHKVFEAVLREAPSPPSSLQASIPKSVDDVILKGLEKSRRDRYQSAAAMKADCDRIVNSLL